MINNINNTKTKSITKIVLTGGPCAGKTTGISWVVDNFTKLEVYI